VQAASLRFRTGTRTAMVSLSLTVWGRLYSESVRDLAIERARKKEFWPELQAGFRKRLRERPV